MKYFLRTDRIGDDYISIYNGNILQQESKVNLGEIEIFNHNLLFYLDQDISTYPNMSELI